MAQRIPQSFIDDLLLRSDIVQIIDRHLPLKKTGANYQALCPFHSEKSPSFTVSASKQFYHCFGCGASGSALNFLMNFLHLNFIEAIENLAHEIGVPIPTQFISTQQENMEPLYAQMEEVSNFYAKKLATTTTTAKRYLLEKRQFSEAIIRRFDIGYAPDAWRSLGQTFGIAAQAKLKATGMLIDKSNGKCYDRFRNRIMFPIRDRRGRVIAFGGRILEDGTPKYLNSPETAIFHKSQELYGLYETLQQHPKLKRLLVVEGYTDVVALAQHGVDYAVATLGTAVTAKHLQRLCQLSPQVIFCFDGDNAGRQAAWRTVETVLPLLQDQWQLQFMFLPNNEDPDSLIRAEGKEKFESRVAQAHTLSDFFLKYMANQSDMSTLDGRGRFARLAFEKLDKVSSTIFKEMLTAAVIKTAGLKGTQLDQAPSNQPPELKKTSFRSSKQVQSTPLRRAITLLLQHPQLVTHCTRLPQLGAPGWDLLHKIIALLQDRPELSTAAIIEHWREQPEFRFLSRLAQVELLMPESGLATEFSAIMQTLQNLEQEQLIDNLMAKLRQQVINPEERGLLQQLIRQHEKRCDKKNS